MTFIKQLLRSPVRAAAFMLLLALSGAMLCIGLNAYVGVNERAAALNENYTTIAVPDYRMSEYAIDNDRLTAESLQEYFNAFYERSRLIMGAKEAAETSDFVDEIERRDIFSAYIPESKPLISGSVDWKKYEAGLDRPYNIAVFSIKCGEIKNNEYTMNGVVDENGEEIPYTEVSYEINAKVESCILLHEDYDSPEELLIRGNIVNHNGEVPFKEGKRYLVWGTYTGQIIGQTGPDSWGVVKESDAILSIGDHPVYHRTTPDLGELEELNGKLYYLNKMLDEYPICKEVPEGVEVEDFMSCEDNKTWRDTINYMCDITLQSLPVITTNRLDSILLFNNREAYIIEGRAFDASEYANGEKVCIVNAEYAVKNGLSIGDEITFFTYNTGYSISKDFLGSFEEVRNVLQVEPYNPEAELNEAEEYKVVGIYRSPGFTFSSYSFSPNTVFIPAASVKPPLAPEGYETDNMDVLYSIVLKNGMAEAFEAELEAQGYGGCFLYYDQGYAEASEGIDAMVLNAGRLMLFSAVLFLTAGVLFAYLYMRWARRSAGIMRLIGARPGQVFTGMSGCALLAAGVSLAVGCVISYFLYDGICEAVFGADGGEMSFSVPWALTGAAAGLVFIMAACMCFFAGVIRRGAMRLNSEHKG